MNIPLTWTRLDHMHYVQNALNNRQYVSLVVKFTDVDNSVTETVVPVYRDTTVVGGGNQCVVCQDHSSEIMLYPCKHKDFCQKCILQSIYKGGRKVPICPMCRGEIVEMCMY
jgi:hypothetical protein